MACDHSEIIAGIVSLAGATFSVRRMPRPSARAHPGDPRNVGQRDPLRRRQPLRPDLSRGDRHLPVLVHEGRLRRLTGRHDARLARSRRRARPRDRRSALPAGCDIPGSTEHWRMNGASHSPALSAGFRDRTLDFLFAHPKQQIRFLDAGTLAWPPVEAAALVRRLSRRSTLRRRLERRLPGCRLRSCVSQPTRMRPTPPSRTPRSRPPARATPTPSATSIPPSPTRRDRENGRRRPSSAAGPCP